MEKSRVTEIKVRIDCNGCVQKIKKALHGVEGIEEVHVDLPQQKITITGSADPGSLVRAIRKTRKTAVICLHEESSDNQQQPEQKAPSEGGEPPANPQEESPKKETPPPKTEPASPPLQRNQPPQTKVSSPPEAAGGAEEENQEIHHRCRDGFNPEIKQGGGAKRDEFREFRERHPSPPIYVAHGYSAYTPSAHVTEYANPGPGSVHPLYATSGNIYRPTEYPNPGQSRPCYATSGHINPRPPPPATEYPKPGQSQPVYHPSSQRNQPVYPPRGNEFRPPPPNPPSVTKYAIPTPPHPPHATTNTRPTLPLYVPQINLLRPPVSVPERVKQPSSDQANFVTSHYTLRPVPSVSENIYPFGDGIEYLQSPPRYLGGLENDEDYYDENIACVFSEENPNSCQIA